MIEVIVRISERGTRNITYLGYDINLNEICIVDLFTGYGAN